MDTAPETETKDPRTVSDGVEWAIVEQALVDLKLALDAGYIRRGKARPLAAIAVHIRVSAAKAGRRGKSWEFAQQKVLVALARRENQDALRECGVSNDRAIAVLTRVAARAFSHPERHAKQCLTGSQLRVSDVVSLHPFFESKAFVGLCNNADLGPSAIRRFIARLAAK